MTDLTYKLTFLSFWHCGSGLSAGADVDALVIKDQQGFPFVPGKTLKGLFRDAANTLKDFGHPAATEALINIVFGEAGDRQAGEDEAATRPGCCFFSDAVLNPAFRQGVMKTSGGAVGHLFSSLTNTAVDEDSGTAKNKSFRRMEVVIPLPLNGFITVSEQPDDVKRLLKACSKLVRRMGTGRHRGLGRCSLVMDEKGGKQ